MLETTEAVLAVCHTVPLMIHLLGLNLKFHLIMAKKILLHMEQEVEQQFS
jgi:hypothetical protein